MEHGLNDPITQTDLDGKLVYIFHARPGGSALGFDVHFKKCSLISIYIRRNRQRDSNAFL